jgi:hypothetical protein
MRAGSFLSHNKTIEGPGRPKDSIQITFSPLKLRFAPQKRSKKGTPTVQSRNVSRNRNINNECEIFCPARDVVSTTRLSFLCTVSLTREHLWTHIKTRGVTTVAFGYSYNVLCSTVLYLPYPESRSCFLFDFPLFTSDAESRVDFAEKPTESFP